MSAGLHCCKACLPRSGHSTPVHAATRPRINDPPVVLISRHHLVHGNRARRGVVSQELGSSTPPTSDRSPQCPPLTLSRRSDKATIDMMSEICVYLLPPAAMCDPQLPLASPDTGCRGTAPGRQNWSEHSRVGPRAGTPAIDSRSNIATEFSYQKCLAGSAVPFRSWGAPNEPYLEGHGDTMRSPGCRRFIGPAQHPASPVPDGRSFRSPDQLSTAHDTSIYTFAHSYLRPRVSSTMRAVRVSAVSPA